VEWTLEMCGPRGARQTETRGDVAANGPVGQCGQGLGVDRCSRSRGSRVVGVDDRGEKAGESPSSFPSQAHAATTLKLGWTRPTWGGTAHAVPVAQRLGQRSTKSTPGLAELG